jgi:hypothetical protein
VWGINGSEEIFHFNFAKQSFLQVQGSLIQIAVRVNDVWGVNSSNEVFRYDPTSGAFNKVGGNTFQVAAGGDGVWLIDTSNFIWRFDSSSESFVQVPGILKSIAVGSGAVSLESMIQIRSSHSFDRRRCEFQQPGAALTGSREPLPPQNAIRLWRLGVRLAQKHPIPRLSRVTRKFTGAKPTSRYQSDQLPRRSVNTRALSGRIDQEAWPP